MLLRHSLLVAAAGAIGLAPLAAQAQSYRCVGTDGKKYYGQSVPPQCIGVVVEQINAQGSVVKRIAPQSGSAVDPAKRAAEEAERKKQATLLREQTRRDQALLATYASEKDVEDMRRRALENDQRILQELEAKIASLKQSGKPSEAELQVQENLLAVKKKEIATINAKYDDDKKRYLELINRGK